MSLLCVCAQLTLQTGHQPLVRVVRHQAHQLHPPLDLHIGHKMLETQNKTKQTYCVQSSHIFSSSMETTKVRATNQNTVAALAHIHL